MKKQVLGLTKGLVKFLVAGALVYWLVDSGRFDLDEVKRSLSPGFALLFLLMTLGNLLFNTQRWQEILRVFKVRFSLHEAFQLNLIGIFFNYAMPGGVGGDLVKGYYTVKKNPTQKTASATSVLLDRLIGLFSMVILAMFALLSQWEKLAENASLQLLGLSIFALLIAFLCLFVVGMSARWIAFIKETAWIAKFNLKGIPFKVLDTFHNVAKDPKLLLRCLGISFISQSFLILLVYVLANYVLMENISLAVVYFAVPLTLIVTALPIAPAGIGVGQVAMYSFFQILGIDNAKVGATAITVIQIMLFAWGLVGSYYYLRMDVPKSAETKGA